MTEFGFIDNIKKLFSDIPSQGFEGIGDDCAILPCPDGSALVFTADMLVEGVHFLRSAASPFEIGRKSLAVNLSDVAAMGAVPVATMLSLALTPDTAGEWADEFMKGYRELSGEHSVPLIGGDTSKSDTRLMINVTAIGRAPMQNIKRRSAARAGDIIMTGGELGASGAGLQDIFDGRCNTPYALIHKNPVPQTAEGAWLGSRSEVHAMMDISDGLASDLPHILKASAAGAEICTEKIPAVTDLRTAVCAGEDYKLLFTVAEKESERLADDYYDRFGYRPCIIGRIVESSDRSIVWLENGRRIYPEWSGFSHF